MFTRDTTKTRFALGAVMLMALTPVLSGCTSTPATAASDTASITYRQVGACNGYVAAQGDNAGGPTGETDATHAGTNSAYVIFRIDTIDNTQSTLDFAFDPARLENGPDHVDTNLSFAQDLQLAALSPTTITHGTSDTKSGFVVMVVQTSAADGASEANQTKYALNYDNLSGGQHGPGVVFLKQNSDQSTWTNTADCHAITYNGS
jgi:hypothetical protein